MRRRFWNAAGAFVLVLPAGLVLGAAIARWLAENLYYRTTLFYHWAPTAAVACLVAVLLALFSLSLSRWRSHEGLAVADAVSFLPFFLPGFYLLQRRVDTVQATVLLAGSLALVAALNVQRFAPRQWVHRAALLAVFTLPLAAYLRTLAPTVGAHDTFEFQVISYELGIAHPTGYPLYVLIGKLFTLIPLGSVAYRVNLSSALFAAATIAVLYATITRLTGDRIASALASLTFAFSLSFWSQAVEAEVYALNALFVSSICYLLLLSFRGAPSSSTDLRGTRADRWTATLDTFRRNETLIIIAAVVYGLSLTHHRTMLLLAPAVIAYFALNRGWRLLTVRRTVLLSIAFLVPLVGIHLYIPVRWWQLHGQPMNWQQFTDLVLGTQFAAALQWDAVLRDAGRLTVYLRTVLEQYPAPALLLAVGGIIYLLSRRASPLNRAAWKEGLFLLLAFAAYAVFGLSYHVPDVALFLIPCYLVIAMALGIGTSALRRALERLLGRAGQAPPPLRRQLAASATLTVVALLPLSLIWTNLPRVDRSDAYASDEWGRYVLQQDLPAGSVILADSEKMAPLHYLQRVEGIRPDTETGVFPDEDSNRVELERRLSEKRPVFLARFLPALEGTYHLRSLGPLAEVSADPLTGPPADLRQLNASFGDSIRLVGYRLDREDVQRTGTIRVTLYWHAQRGLRENFDVRLRLLGSKGHVWLQTSGRPPVNGLYPTAAWRPGELVPDFHQIDLAGQVPPGSYRLQVGLFAPFTEKGIAQSDSAGGYITLANVSVSSPTSWRPAINHPMRASFEDQIMLLGYDFPSTVAPGLDLPLTLYWQPLGRVGPDYDIVLRLTTPSNEALWQAVEQPLFGEHPTSDWSTGELLADTHQVTIPETASGPLHLRISLRDPGSGQYLEVVDGWLGGRQREALLASPALSESPTISTSADYLPANFDNKILLLDYEIHNVQVRKADALRLTLRWQAQAPMDEDYTVFVHLLDDNNQIWGQEDTQPAYGTHPTSRWREAEVVLDPHTVWTQQQAPLGLYRIEVGFYLLRTMERLQLLDASGTAIDNRLVVDDLVEIVP